MGSKSSTSAPVSNTSQADNRVAIGNDGASVGAFGSYYRDSSSATASAWNSGNTNSVDTRVSDSSVRDYSTRYADNSSRTFDDHSLQDFSSQFSDSSNRSTTVTDNSSRDNSTRWTDNSSRDNSTKWTDSSTRSSSVSVSDASSRDYSTTLTDSSSRNWWQDASTTDASQRNYLYDSSNRSSNSDSSSRNWWQDASTTDASQRSYAYDSSNRSSTDSHNVTNVTTTDAGMVEIAKLTTGLQHAITENQGDAVKTIARFGSDAITTQAQAATNLFATGSAEAGKAWGHTIDASSELIDRLLTTAQGTITGAQTVARDAIQSYQPTDNANAGNMKIAIIGAVAMIAASLLARRA